jgi:hypothetical protein
LDLPREVVDEVNCGERDWIARQWIQVVKFASPPTK